MVVQHIYDMDSLTLSIVTFLLVIFYCINSLTMKWWLSNLSISTWQHLWYTCLCIAITPFKPHISSYRKCLGHVKTGLCLDRVYKHSGQFLCTYFEGPINTTLNHHSFLSINNLNHLYTFPKHALKKAHVITMMLFL